MAILYLSARPYFRLIKHDYHYMNFYLKYINNKTDSYVKNFQWNFYLKTK